jgi:DNA polymerase III alpha subunit (gram-positive type)
MKTQVMLDLETLGSKPGSVIVSIGAVKFGEGKITESFYERIDPQSSLTAGLKIDSPTIAWWLRQSPEALSEIAKPGRGLTTVLSLFSEWIDDKNAEVWGNGAAFDNVLLSVAYDAGGIAVPWHYWNDRCYRTLKNLHPEIEPEREGTHHNALDDATTQALHLMTILKANQ